MYNQVKNCFENMKNVILLKIPENNNKRKNFIIIIKITILDLIISLIEEGISDDNDINNLKDIMINFQPFELYNEIKICFEFIYKKYENFYKGIELDNIKIIEKFKELYKFNYNFQTCIELKLSFKIFHYLKILMEVYGRNEVHEFFKHLNKKYQETLEQEKEIYLLKKDKNNNNNNKNENENNFDENNEFNQKKSIVAKEENNNKYSKFSHIRTNRTIKNQKNPSINFNLTSNTNFPLINSNNNNQTNNPFFNPIKHTKTFHSQPLKKSMTKILHKTLSTKSKENDFISISEKISLNKINYFIYIFLKQIITRIQIRNEANESARDFSIFVIPPLCLLLSKSTKKNFFDNVDRKTVADKILGLIEQTDYFIYEMFYNKLQMNNFNKFSQFLCNLNIKSFEYINYALIIFQNCLLAVHFYSTKPIENKHKIYIDNEILCIFQLVFILIVLTIYFLYKFELKYKHNIMKIYKVKFFYHNNLIFENENNLLENLGNNLTYMNKLYTLFQSLVLNEEINIFIFSFIFILSYLLMSNGIFLAIPLLFITNLNDLLYGIIYALRLNIFPIFFLLLFMYLFVYLFTWFAFLYFSQLFEFSELYSIKLHSNVEEKLCSSLIQCFLTMSSYGVRSGGGIGDVIPMLSYKANPGYFIAGFFFVVLFHIIIFIMINLLFGIILDSFVVLKNKIYKTKEDKKNICYICQITRDSALNKNINFNKHINNIHNIWNYVFFMVYLHINNERNFKSLETFVWEKILQNHTSWFPIGEEYCKPDLENY